MRRVRLELIVFDPEPQWIKKFEEDNNESVLGDLNDFIVTIDGTKGLITSIEVEGESEFICQK